MTEHLKDLQADRRLGQNWERNFCKLAGAFGLCFSPLQIGRKESAQAYFKNSHGAWQRVTLPDVTIWSAPGQHHEIKHKDPTRDGCFGLEKYRWECLKWFAEQTGQLVLYTIHNHALSGGREGKENCLDHWFSASVQMLDGTWERIRKNGSWINSRAKTDGVDTIYWHESIWIPAATALRHELDQFGKEPAKEESDLEAADAELEKIKSELARERQERKRHYKDWFGKGKSQARFDNLQAYSEWSQT